MDNKYKQHVEILKVAFIREVGIFLDKLMKNKIIAQTKAYDDFGISPSTLRTLSKGDSCISFSVLRKMPYILAYYLDVYHKKIDSEDNGMEKKKMQADFPGLMEEFKSLYGFQATFCLELIEKGRDLREIVKHP